jgi:lipopolysaccharide/colanic/teichoic acid biosynthesis glycosyltransferase
MYHRRVAPTVESLHVKKVPVVIPSYAQRQTPVVRARRRPAEGTYFLVKRLLDLGATILILILSAPLWIAIAIAIKATSPGPVLFRQERIGARRVRDGRRNAWEPTSFTMYKFRSMKLGVAADPHRAFTEAFIRGDTDAMTRLNKGATMFKLVDDDRVTRVGTFLRRTSLDELPQLINVLTGEMSLVGPRPALPYEVELYKPWHMRRLTAPPGITGLWQVVGRSTVTFDEMVELDIRYVVRRSIALDLWILFQTPLAVLRRRGAA